MRRRNRHIAQDRIAMRIAARYGMTYDYKTARRNGLDPLEALEDWDLIRPEERALFLEPYSTTTAPQPLIAGKDPQSPALNNMTNKT